MLKLLGSILLGLGGLGLISMAPAVFSKGGSAPILPMILAGALCAVGEMLRNWGKGSSDTPGKPINFPDRSGGSAEAEYDNGMVEAGRGNFQAATSHFQNSVHLSPTYAPSTAMLELISDHSDGKIDSNALQSCLRGANALNGGDPKTALAAFSEMIRLAPEYSPGYMQRGNAHQLLGDMKGAVADFDLALKYRPNTSFIYQARGTAHMNLENYDAALADLNRAVELNPDQPFAYTTRGMLFHKLGKSSNMCADFRKAADLGLPDNYNLAKQKGLCP